MSLSRQSSVCTGRCTAAATSGAPRARMALLTCLALALGGCSSVAPLPNSGLISTFASSAPVRTVAAPADIEADGLEAQRPPPLRMYAKEDDPSQPFSPNYGSIPLDPAWEVDVTPTTQTKEAAVRGEHPI